ncbi:restriction endonuclease subunit S [uncultured Oxalicibacterium sp.]|uniref:restriction endonuclease subunit S n=1 Tax=uncultured Oxalicibacterium sp. TaxID=1168540 RepID=UPI0025DA1309|nr:restriction endonuclease subunit S [uncultured Oxalicibacterium sp.]
MAKESKKVLVPKLRFPEFKDAEGWHLTHGDQLFDAINDRSPSEALPILAITQEYGAIPRDQIDYHVSVTEQSIESYKVVEKGDFIISLRSFQGGIEYSNYRGICSPAYVILRRKGDGSDGYFRHLFKSARFIQQLTRNIEGLRDGKMISYKQFSEQQVPVPSPAEQKKIAECLSSLDELIAAQGRKVEGLKTYKRGLMQQLFPREGENFPRLRFPEFRDVPEWTDKKLSAVIDLVSGLHLSPDEYSIDGDIPYFTGPSDFSNDVEGASKWTKASSNIAKENDTLITVKGSGVGEIWYLEIPSVAIGRQLMAVRAHHDCSNRFIFQLLLTKSHRFEDLAAGNLIPGLARGDVLNLVAPIPEKDEQEKIASFLSSLDDRIAHESKQLDILKSHKKGLMQKLFPLLGEKTHD